MSETLEAKVDVESTELVVSHPGGSADGAESKDCQVIEQPGPQPTGGARAKTGTKRKPAPVAKTKAVFKRSRSHENTDTRAIRKYGHLVHQGTKKPVKHALGRIAIPDAPRGEDSEFEDEVFCRENKVTLWESYVSLLNDILSNSTLGQEDKRRLEVVGKELCEESDFPGACPVRDCTRHKPICSKLGLLRHIVERHLPSKPMWRCPYGKGGCTDVQPRKIAHVRHVGWEHGRPYAQAAANTFMEDLKHYVVNKRYDNKFKIVSGLEERFFKQIGKPMPEDTYISPPSSFKKLVITSSSSEDEMENSPCCEIIDSIIDEMIAHPTETEVAASTLENILEEMDALHGTTVEEGGSVEAEASRQLIPIPDLFKFDPGSVYRDPRTGEMENLLHMLSELEINCQKQMELQKRLKKSSLTLRTMVDEHEGSLKLSGENLQEVIDIRQRLYKSQQRETEASSRAKGLEAENLCLKAQGGQKAKSILLLEDHVKNLQEDVRRLSRDVDTAVARATQVEQEKQDETRKVEALEVQLKERTSLSELIARLSGLNG